MLLHQVSKGQPRPASSVEHPFSTLISNCWSRLSGIVGVPVGLAHLGQGMELITGSLWSSPSSQVQPRHKAVGHLEHTTSCVPSPPHSRRCPARPSELSGQRHRSPHPSGGHGAKGVPLNTFYTHLLTPRERSGIISLCAPKRHQAASTQTLSHVRYLIFTVGESSLVDGPTLEIPSGRRYCDEI